MCETSIEFRESIIEDITFFFGIEGSSHLQFYDSKVVNNKIECPDINNYGGICGVEIRGSGMEVSHNEFPSVSLRLADNSVLSDNKIEVLGIVDDLNNITFKDNQIELLDFRHYESWGKNTNLIFENNNIEVFNFCKKRDKYCTFNREYDFEHLSSTYWYPEDQEFDSPDKCGKLLITDSNKFEILDPNPDFPYYAKLENRVCVTQEKYIEAGCQDYDIQGPVEGCEGIISTGFVSDPEKYLAKPQEETAEFEEINDTKIIEEPSSSSYEKDTEYNFIATLRYLLKLFLQNL